MYSESLIRLLVSVLEQSIIDIGFLETEKLFAKNGVEMKWLLKKIWDNQKSKIKAFESIFGYDERISESDINMFVGDLRGDFLVVVGCVDLKYRDGVLYYKRDDVFRALSKMGLL